MCYYNYLVLLLTNIMDKMNDMFKKVFSIDYVYCKKHPKNHPMSDRWECTGGFDSYLEADKTDSSYPSIVEPVDQVGPFETRLMCVPNILPDILKEKVLEHQLAKTTIVYYKTK